MIPATQKRSGFTLVELSIVLVIIGLIAGGVVGGQSLIRSSRLNAVAADIQQYKVAINTFGLQYDTLPGDISDAWDYWGTDCDTNADRCNGDGDNKIFGSNTGGREERVMFWNHLFLAKILNNDLEQTYQTAPFTPINDGSRYSVEHYGQYYHSGRGSDQRNHYITLNVNNNFANYTLTPAETYQLDKKHDNGLPGLGDVRAAVGDNSGDGSNKCATTQDTETARSNLDNDSIACTPYFLWD
jgi:prepilin-type N-terminal cleavage/methylation domain-containing protein